RQPGANVIEVVSQIRTEIPKLQRSIPAGVNLTVVSDRTVTIRASVHDVQFTLVLSVVLVTLVVLLFLRSLRATLIAGVALTLSLIAFFIPLLFMSGLVGRMFREFALTLTIAVVTSAVVSLTLTPMMCSRILKHAGGEMAVPGLAAISRGIDRMVGFYHRTLLWVLERQRATLLVTFATLAATLILYVVAPKGFLPLQDTASITAVTQAGPDVSFAGMQHRQTQAADAI